MPMISLRKYLQGSDLDLQGSAVAAPGLEDIANGRKTAASQESPVEVLSQASNAVDWLRQHQDGAVQPMRDPVAGLRSTVHILADDLRLVSSSQSEVRRKLQQMRVDLNTPFSPKDLRAWRERLLEEVEAILLHSDSESVALRRVDDLVEASIRPEAKANTTSDVDPTTGLPGRRQAEFSIAEACQDGCGAVVVVLVMNNMATIVSSFGADFGDVLLQRFASVVRDQFGDDEELFRWDGPVVIALVRRNRSARVRAAIDALLQRPTFVKSSRGDVQVPISARWAMLPISASPRLVFQNIDKFADLDGRARKEPEANGEKATARPGKSRITGPWSFNRQPIRSPT
jgi:GGDEF domain-containing protein